MKNPLLWIVFTLLLAAGFIIGWMDNGPKKVNVETLPSRFDE